MARKAFKSTNAPLRLLHWTEPVKAKAGTDPLGLALRVGARLAGQLLYCITSITPRARYYSFLPWCVREYRKTLRGQERDPGIVKAVQQWEKALVLGCVVHHEGKPCLGGGLVGSSKVVEWFNTESGIPTQLDLSSRSFSKNPALGQYFGSLINLGVFKANDSADENEHDDEALWIDCQSQHLGHVPKGLNNTLRNLLPAYKVSASIERLNGTLERPNILVFVEVK